MNNTQPSPAELAWLKVAGLTPLRAEMTPASIETICADMIDRGVRPQRVAAWAIKQRARATINRAERAIELRKREAFSQSLVFKTHDPAESEQRRRRFRAIKARAERTLRHGICVNK